MIRMTFLIPGPDTGDPAEALREFWLPLFDAAPGKLRLDAALVSERPFGGTAAAAIVDLYFEDAHAMDAAMASAPGKALARAVMDRPGQVPEVLVSEVCG